MPTQNPNYLSPSSWNLENFARVDFKLEQIDRLIHQKGVNCIWQRSMLCSCVNPLSGQPDFTCPACEGKGYVHFDPKALRVAVTTLTGARDGSMPLGLLDVGTALMTTKSTDIGINFRDRLTFPDFRISYSEIITYSSMDSQGEKLKYECENLISVQQLGTVIPPTAYTLSADKRYITLAPNTVSDGSQVALLYEIKPVYIVTNVPHELRGTFVKFGYPEEEFLLLPKQYQIKREDLIPLQRGEVSS